MEQLELFNNNKYENKSDDSDYKYTVGVINDYESLWFVSNDNKNKNESIMEYLLMYPNTRPLQSNYKHYIYQLRDNNKK